MIISPITRGFIARALSIAAAVLLLPSAAPAARAQTTVLTPGASGDQLIFLYDATGNRTPFIAVSNFAPAPVIVETAFYGGASLGFITREVATIPARGNLPVIDPGDAARFPGVKGTAGLVVVTPIVSATDPRPIVPPAPSLDPAAGSLFGGFTLANLDLGAAFGQNPLARLAVDASGARASAGSLVDGVSVQFQRFAPDVLTVPFYFNPTTLSDPAKDGNRILLAAFTDTYSNTGFRIAPTTPGFSFDYVMEDSSGTTLVNTFSDVGRTDPIAVDGVLFTNLQTLAGSVPLTTQGKVAFVASTSPIPSTVNVFGLVSQAVGPFAVGQILPGGNSVAPVDPGSKSSTLLCATAHRDVWTFAVRTGEQVTVIGDLVSQTSPGDLSFSLSCTSNVDAVQGFATTSDDATTCNTLLPEFSTTCPRADFTWTRGDGTCVVSVSAKTGPNVCPGGSNAVAYRLAIGGSGTDHRLTLVGHNL